MPSISAPAKVLVTGANGYLATWMIRYLLERGYSVRGAVRSLAKAEHIQKMFRPYGSAFEIAVVSELTTEGAFDEAVKGVDAIAHTATPVTLPTGHPDGEYLQHDSDIGHSTYEVLFSEIINPAVCGVRGILKSAFKHG
jgi:uncharacterized protein YbjT (DUF2867 family)